MSILRPALLALLLTALPALAQEATPWKDPSPHKAQFVTVGKDVKLEVLDWGGNGRPLVLLAGMGYTAHVFDVFAPKLSSEYHVYGITRRGYGESGVPESGYSADRLGDDVLAVLDALKIDKAVLVGHSLGGEELTSVADQHPERVAGLVYLDAGYAYAYYDDSRVGDDLKSQIDWNELKRKAELLFSGNEKTQQKSVADLLNAELPAFEKDLQQFDQWRSNVPLAPPPSATPDEQKNIDAYRAYFKRTFGLDIPEAEFREQRQSIKDHGPVAQAIVSGMQKYTEIKGPVLAIFAGPHEVGPYAHNDPGLGKFNTYDTDYMKRVAEGFQKGVPSARVVLLPYANHFVFLSNEADVLREMRAFIQQLP